jgi:tRNA pseudouridine38-40 synthase
MSFFYRLVIQYKGTGYSGWQVQRSTDLTIQGQLNKALQKLCKSDKIKSLGSGRTDAGVHALGQVVRVELPLALPTDGLKKGLNGFLPQSIRVITVEECSVDFHPVRSAESKEYLYFFSDNHQNALFSDLITLWPYPMDFHAVHKAIKLFEGEHDFVNYFCVGTDVNSTVRTIFSADFTEVKDHHGPLPPFVENGYCFRFRGSGFLKQMVRLMVGTLWAIGQGKVSESDLTRSLEGPITKKLAAVAPPQGLYLGKVFY